MIHVVPVQARAASILESTQPDNMTALLHKCIVMTMTQRNAIIEANGRAWRHIYPLKPLANENRLGDTGLDPGYEYAIGNA